ncbi:hypothetical protein ACN47A_19140 [Myxococcus fulvus]|uniref:hypothetical protein n=1 Tax=Myxococcus fulvus TaxID=33 RepID=UPI003B9D2476
MPNPSASRPAGSAVLFTNGDTSYEFFRDLGAERVGECVMLKCLSPRQVTDATEKYPRTRARLEYVGAEVAAALPCAHACSDDAGFARGIVNRVQTEPGAGPSRRTLTKPPTA